MLAVGAMVFSHDANVLVLRPIERMINKVEKIRETLIVQLILSGSEERISKEKTSNFSFLFYFITLISCYCEYNFTMVITLDDYAKLTKDDKRRVKKEELEKLIESQLALMANDPNEVRTVITNAINTAIDKKFEQFSRDMTDDFKKLKNGFS